MTLRAPASWPRRQPRKKRRPEQDTSAALGQCGHACVPLCTTGVCTDPGLPKYGGPTARDSSVQQPPEAEEKTPPNTLNESKSA
jgi:hypothetical protein